MNTFSRSGSVASCDKMLSVKELLLHGWASAELPRNRVNVNLFLRHIEDVYRYSRIFDFVYQNELHVTM